MSSPPPPTPTPPTSVPVPSDDDKSEFLLSCRYGELDDVRRFVDTFGAELALTGVKDTNANTPLHMVAGNGHEGKAFLFDFFLNQL